MCADIFQASNDVGSAIAAATGAYWVGEAMEKTDYEDGPKPGTTGARTNALAANTAHLARLLAGQPTS